MASQCRLQSAVPTASETILQRSQRRLRPSNGFTVVFYSGVVESSSRATLSAMMLVGTVENWGLRRGKVLQLLCVRMEMAHVELRGDCHGNQGWTWRNHSIVLRWVKIWVLRGHQGVHSLVLVDLMRGLKVVLGASIWWIVTCCACLHWLRRIVRVSIWRSCKEWLLLRLFESPT